MATTRCSRFGEELVFGFKMRCRLASSSSGWSKRRRYSMRILGHCHVASTVIRLGGQRIIDRLAKARLELIADVARGAGECGLVGEVLVGIAVVLSSERRIGAKDLESLRPLGLCRAVETWSDQRVSMD